MDFTCFIHPNFLYHRLYFVVQVDKNIMKLITLNFHNCFVEKCYANTINFMYIYKYAKQTFIMNSNGFKREMGKS